MMTITTKVVRQLLESRLLLPDITMSTAWANNEPGE